ncbi:hypothetical protein GH741_14550 [Aquibacillus halophilus]|uniref:Uncharacterized protein n=2 Tax=Aquibacillus halophilus TaxID=930132 RepID=A0A6A8DF61_9BACI|nr:hypothetical protein [Aquibacillus halophilus]
MKKLQELGTTGIKPILTTICLYLVAILNILAYLLNSFGIISWFLTILLLLLGAYFMKHMPSKKVVKN